MDTLPDTVLVAKSYKLFDILRGLQAQPLVNTLPDTVAKEYSGVTLRYIAPCGR